MSNYHNKPMSRTKKFLIALIGVLISIALGLTCALWFRDASPRVAVSDVPAGEVAQSGTGPMNLTSSGSYSYTSSGQIVNNDVISMSYTGSGCYTLTLPMGTYTFYCWGAEGGSCGAGTNGGGLGGYAYGTYTSTTNFTVYVYIGGKGSDATNSIDGGYDYNVYGGGYNGGGAGSGRGGPGGGGCTDMRIGGSSYSYQVIVAGGGGGGLTRSTGNTPSGSGRYYGQSGCSSRHSSRYSNDEGGGGGGYYGGNTIHGDDPRQGYAGSNYTGSLSSAGNSYGQRAGNGYAQIKAISVNQAPVAKNGGTTINIGSRMEGKTTNISPDQIAVDPDTNKTALKYTNGASNLDTFSYGSSYNNTQLYIPNSSGGVDTSATSVNKVAQYIQWTWTSDSNLSITQVLKYPRNGVDGCTQNGRLTLYVKIRDSFGGTNTAARGWGYIIFYLKINANTVSRKANATTVGTGENMYYLGLSDANAGKPVTEADANSIYNPLGGNRYTLIPKQSIKFETEYKIEAKDLLNGVINKDMALIVPKSTTAFTGDARKYSIKEYDNRSTNAVTAYNSGKVAISNAFTSLTFKCEKPDPEYQLLSCTLYVVEKSTAYGSSYPNTVADIATMDIDIVFKMDNARPTLKDTSVKAPEVEIDAMGSLPVKLATFYEDVDVSAGITSATHTIRGVKVPLHEYVQLDKYGSLVSTTFGNPSKSYFNVSPLGSDINEAALSLTSDSGALKTGELVGGGATYATGFAESYITDTVSDTAFISYSFSGDTLTLTGLRATYDMYPSTRKTSGKVASASNASGGLDLGSAAIENAGHFYILINVQDKNDTADTGIWLPLGIKVKNVAPTDMGSERGAVGKTTLPTAAGAPSTVAYFSPMGITVDKVTSPIGKYIPNGSTSLTNANLIPLASDADNFFSSNMLNGSDETGFLNELLTIVSTVDEVRNSVTYNNAGEYFIVEELPIYIPVDYFSGRLAGFTAAVENVRYFGELEPAVDCYVVRGLKITLKNWTHNRYLHATVKIKDSQNDKVIANGVEGVKIAINVTNESPTAITGDDAANDIRVATFNYVGNGLTAGSSYDAVNSVITYNIPMHSSVIITPYDLLKDENIAKSGITFPTTGFTLNGLTGRYNATTGKFTQGSSNSSDGSIVLNGFGAQNYGTPAYIDELSEVVGKLNNARTFSSTTDVTETNAINATKETDKRTFADRLYFERTTDGANLDAYKFDPYTGGSKADFASPTVNGAAYIDYQFGNTIKFKDVNTPYNLDFIVVTAVTRTIVPVEITLNVRDRTGAGATGASSGLTTIRVKINVINSSPRVQYPNKTYTLTTNPLGVSSYPVDDASANFSVIPSVLTINASCSSATAQRENDFLVDNESDLVAFYTGAAINVRVKDGPGSTYNDITDCLRVSITSSTLTITALNSTQHHEFVYVVFYATDGRSSGGSADFQECYIRVQVKNAKLDYNFGENGFEKDETNRAVWNVETLTSNDITNSRYFASNSTTVGYLKTNAGIKASDSQIKTVAVDTDANQKILLSPVNNSTEGSDTTVIDHGYWNASGTDYHSYVPTIALSAKLEEPEYSPNSGIAAVAMLSNRDTSKTINDYLGPNSYDILYFVDTTGTSMGNGVHVFHASKLRSAGNPSATPAVEPDDECKFIDANHELFFDEQGRWKVSEWAIVLTPLAASQKGDYLRVALMLRDDAANGGDTCGLNTAYDITVDPTSTFVDGFIPLSFYMFINNIGILPSSYYNQFDGYYTVTDNDGSKTYLPTYDGNPDSVYGASASSTLSLYGKTKSRGSTDVDDTNAGIHSGLVYTSGMTTEYDVYVKNAAGTDYEKAVEKGEKAFRYSDTIKISSEKNNTGNFVNTYVPMSYFGLRKNIVKGFDESNNSIIYDKSFSVAFNIPGQSYTLNSSTTYQAAVAISDGVETWTGETGARRLSLNPYVNVSVYDERSVTNLNSDITGSPYFNKCLSYSTTDTKNGGAKIDIYSSGTSADANVNNTVGPDGELLYLQGQESNVLENKFGLVLSKKNTRSSAASLTITVYIAQCSVGGTGNAAGTGDFEVSAGDDVSEDELDEYTARVSYKLEIGNSPIKLKTTDAQTGVGTDSTKGYYTKLVLNAGDSAYSLDLGREAVASTETRRRTILFEDDDKVLTESGAVIANESDNAYFYLDSTRGANRWSEDVFKRATEYTGTGSNFRFANTAGSGDSDLSDAQKSMRNYFGSRESNGGVLGEFSAISNANNIPSRSAFVPNDGKYNNSNITSLNEGYGVYFSVDTANSGRSLTITPLRKTVINKSSDGNVTPSVSDYNARGLEFDNSESGGMGYYPLKVLIYDSHGDGPEVGSYVSLEIRVYVIGSTPKLSTNLESDRSSGPNSTDRKLELSLPVGGHHTINIAEYVSSNELLTKVNGDGTRDIFWLDDYKELESKTTKTIGDELNLDTGTYLKSPLSNYSGSNPSDTDLRKGTAGFTDNKNSTQAAVIMYMEYDAGSMRGATPSNNEITFLVNRRLTVSQQAINSFKFRLNFTDSDNRSTPYLNVYINVVNSTPVVRDGISALTSNFKMRVGDTFTVLTTPFDRFMGTVEGGSGSTRFGKSDESARQSLSYKYYSTNYSLNSNQSSNFKIDQRRLCVNATERSSLNGAPEFENLTSAAVNANGTYVLHSYNKNNSASQHLGYLALFDDDSPWDLRFVSADRNSSSPVRFYDNSGCFKVEELSDSFPISSASPARPLSLTIKAQSCCTDYPVMITAMDGDGAFITCTLYLTVESSPPVALKNNDNRRHVGLYTEYDRNHNEIEGEYSAYFTAATSNSTAYKDMSVVVGEDDELRPLTETKKVYGTLELTVRQIAYDPDANDYTRIALYNDDSDHNYNVFMFNGMPMQKSGMVYTNDLFQITIGEGYTSFKIKCITYNPYNDYDELSFYIRDVGNNTFANAIPIVIKLVSLYSPITNAAQATSAQINGNSIRPTAPYTLSVKSIDDYTGKSAYVQSLPLESEDGGMIQADIVDQNSTYTVLNYKNAPESVDNAAIDNKRLNDPDVSQSVYNLNYGIKVYALMDINRDDARLYDSISLADAGAFFNFDTINNIWSLKTGADVRNYLVAGINTNGGRMTGINSALNIFLSRYFIFDIGEDGVSLTFRPVSANLDCPILFYVQVEKESYRAVVPTEVPTACGTMFYVQVEDSAPIANADRNVASFAGKKGESAFFKIFDESDPDSALFEDSDVGDVITVPGFVGSSDEVYKDALAEADCDWQHRSGVERAITITVNNTDSVVDGIPARSVRATVNRRIDKQDDDGNYLSEVTLPVIISGIDKKDKTVTSRLYITVCNSDFDLSDSVANGNSNVMDMYGVGYSVTRDGGTPKTYDINVSVAPGENVSAMPIHFVTKGWFNDPDYTSMIRDTESFKLIVPDNIDREKYVGNSTYKVKSDDGNTEDIAEITPLYGNEGELNDILHFEGISIVAKSYKRGITGSGYLRIVDRSCADEETGGITIRVNITVLNAAPEVRPGKKNTSIIITGSDTVAPDEFIIDVNDYVQDLNGDELRIYSRYPLQSDDIHCTNTRENEGDIFDISSADAKVTVKPRIGFYGSQTLRVYVADGDASTDSAVRTTDFSVSITVLYDHRAITELNTIHAIRSLPTAVTPEKLFKSITDTYVDESNKGGSQTSRILNSAEGEPTFNPGKDFIITGLQSSSSIVSIDKNIDGEFQFTCSREADEVIFVATFIRSVDADLAEPQTFNKQFKAVIGKNSSPTLIANFSRDGGYTFHTGNGDYDLDSNGSVTLTADRLFTDVDLAMGDKLVFDKKVIEVVSPTMCSVKVSDDGAYLTITFHYRGETDITLGVKDRTGETTKVKLHVNNIDRPEASFITKLKISYESSPFIWLGVAIGFVVLIVLLIIIILLLKRRKRKREELEAILVSEMELEEQMMMLSGGPGAMPYASFGYLPPTVNIQNNPGLMLDAGGAVPNSNAIGLNPGQEATPPTAAQQPPADGSDGFDEF